MRVRITVDADELLTPGQGEWLIEAPGELHHGEPPVLRYERYPVMAGPCCDGCGFERHHSLACPQGAGGATRHIVKPLRGVW